MLRGRAINDPAPQAPRDPNQLGRPSAEGHRFGHTPRQQFLDAIDGMSLYDLGQDIPSTIAGVFAPRHVAKLAKMLSPVPRPLKSVR
jgi:hypothetical protein